MEQRLGPGHTSGVLSRHWLCPAKAGSWRPAEGMRQARGSCSGGGKVREKDGEGQAQTASCFAKLKIDFSTVLFKDKSLHSSAILA